MMQNVDNQITMFLDIHKHIHIHFYLTGMHKVLVTEYTPYLTMMVDF